MIGRASRGTRGWIGSSQATPRFGFNSLKDFLAVRRPRPGSERRGQLDPGGLQVSLGPRDHQANDDVKLNCTGDQRWRF